MPELKFKLAEFGMVIRFDVPLKDRAPPNFPPVLQVAPVIVPVLPLPETSLTVVPLPSLNP